ncbi:HEAT repeat domain-containing protein [Methanosarcina sp. 2.H.A.1B.4]|uniref:HEAT repeat domain-containing protein n=1 Tax=Methanosarcina sp. 2.H.A.1B.4 TaxID=1483600 RepID=UPI000622AB4C|nr:HEAT repeat domain-containing protein [Methanosarcina sp. 2.H.A.1B.4]KKG12536.1 hypothetical protein EO92_01595 [Methanosarcina sp. 2.H.A.1B.4]
MQEINKENYEQFKLAIDRFLEINPNDADIWIIRGNILKKLENYIQALESYNKAIKIESKNIEPYFQKFMVYDKFENFEEALKALKKVIELKSSYLTGLEKEGLFSKTFSTNQQTTGQHSLYEESNQKTADYWCKKSVDFFLNGKTEEALNAINESLCIDSECAEALYKKSEILHYIGQPDEALGSVEKSLKLSPKCSKSWCKKSAVLNDLGHTDEALGAVELAIDIDSSFAEAWCQKGIILYYKEEYQDALKAIEEALRINPDYALATSFKKKIFVYITQHQKETKLHAEPIKTDILRKNSDVDKEKSKNIESLTFIDKNESSPEKSQSIKNTSRLLFQEANDKNYYCIICGKILDQYGNICSENCMKIYKTFISESRLRSSYSISIKGFCNSCGKSLELKRNLHRRIENKHPECYSKNSIYSEIQREKHKYNEKQSPFCIICGKQLNQRKGFACSNECLYKYKEFKNSTKSSFKGFCNFCGKPHELIKENETEIVMHRHKGCYSRTSLSEESSQDTIDKINDHEEVKLLEYEDRGGKNKNYENKKRSYCIICGKVMGNEGKWCSKRCVEIYYKFHKSPSTSINGFCNFCGKPIPLVKNNHKLLIMHESCYQQKHNSFKDSSKFKENDKLKEDKEKVINHLHTNESIESLVGSLNDERMQVRINSTEKLGTIKDPSTVKYLIEVLNDDYPAVRESAIKALENLGSCSVELLIEAMKSDDRYIKQNATKALGNIGDSRGLVPLTLAIKDKNRYVRKYSAESLGKIGDKNTIEQLKYLLDDKYSDVRESASISISEINERIKHS